MTSHTFYQILTATQVSVLLVRDLALFLGPLVKRDLSFLLLVSITSIGLWPPIITNLAGYDTGLSATIAPGRLVDHSENYQPLFMAHVMVSVQF